MKFMIDLMESSLRKWNLTSVDLYYCTDLKLHISHKNRASHLNIFSAYLAGLVQRELVLVFLRTKLQNKKD